MNSKLIWLHGACWGMICTIVVYHFIVTPLRTTRATELLLDCRIDAIFCEDSVRIQKGTIMGLKKLIEASDCARPAYM